MFDARKLYAAELQALVGGGEAPLAAEVCQQAYGTDQLDRPPADWKQLLRTLPEPIRDRVAAALGPAPGRRIPPKAWEKALGIVLEAVQGDLIDIDVDFEQLIGGVAAAGHAGSYAAQVVAALEGSTGGNYCVVSDHRLIIAEHQISTYEFIELASVPRQAVVGARRRGRFLQRGRVVLVFVDLSQVALMTGMLSTRPANRLIAALRGAA